MVGQEKGLVRAGEARFATYLDGITAVLGHASRATPGQDSARPLAPCRGRRRGVLCPLDQDPNRALCNVHESSLAMLENRWYRRLAT